MEQKITRISKLREYLRDNKQLEGCTLIGLDFSSERDLWNSINAKGVNFWGCKFPEGVSNHEIAKHGGIVENELDSCPFKLYRTELYSQHELLQVDRKIYDFFISRKNDLVLERAKAIYDFSLREAIFDYMKGKVAVAIFGGHAMKRNSQVYKTVVLLSKKLTEEGFCVVTGGGPGAMEAGNLGALFAGKSDADVEEALELIGKGNENFKREYENEASAKAVTDRFGIPDDSIPSPYHYSVGIPTFEFGNEPPNRFSARVGKLFSKAIRQDMLVEVANGGAIVCPGSSGTRQEIFQFSCNTFDHPEAASPIVFFQKAFWEENGIYDVCVNLYKKEPFADLVAASDEIEEIVSIFKKFRKTRFAQ